MQKFGLLSAGLLACAACSSDDPTPQNAPPRDEITLGDGSLNMIDPNEMTRTDATLTFREVTIANNGWLVIHPFKDGRPDGLTYIGHTYLPAGHHTNVAVELPSAPQPGEPMLVMLHQDVDEDQVFDFVFVDERNVEDRAVFEGSTMIAHIFVAP